MHSLRFSCLVLIHCAMASALIAAEPIPPSEQFLAFIKRQAAELRRDDKPPRTMRSWQEQKDQLRTNLQQAWGTFPETPCPLEPRKLGELKRDGYRIEKIIFQSMPGVWMTANAYVPDTPGKHPAVLCVHGHWRGAKQDPVVQSRCIGLAKHGFFVLVVDAFGAGERAIGKALGEYHGEMTAATLFPAGLTLCGLQVYENSRAVDYLQSRPEVDASKIGVSGASGGGNQSMYAGAWENRIAAAVPTCSVGNYQAYLGAACCMCEVVPGALRFTEEWGILALTAPRALMVISATQDAFQFSVGEAKKSLAVTEKVYQLFGRTLNLHHAVFESKHDYSQPMREATYGWMSLHLAGRGDGRPLPEGEIKTEDPEALRCFPGESRPEDWITIPKFAAAKAKEAVNKFPAVSNEKDWARQSKSMKTTLVEQVFGGFPKRNRLNTAEEADGVFSFETEPGLRVYARHERSQESRGLVVLLDFNGIEKTKEQTRAFIQKGWDVVTADLRATGRTAYSRDLVRRAPDHNTAEWSLWIGRPLLGQWTWDVRRLLDALEDRGTKLPKNLSVIGIGPAGVVALCAGALDERIRTVVTVNSLASYVSDAPYENQRLGLMAPGILPKVGDISHLAGLLAPRRLSILDGVTGAGGKLSADSLKANFAFTRAAYEVTGASNAFTLGSASSLADVAGSLK